MRGWEVSPITGQSREETRGRQKWLSVGRGDMIRTRDPLLPKQMLYQAELRPDECRA